MQHIVKSLLSPVFGKDLGNKLRLMKVRWRRKIYTRTVTLTEFRDHLLQHGDWSGRTVWIQSSWNDMYNLSVKPTEIIELFRSMVGPTGNLVMPAFPLDPNTDRILKIDSAPVSTGLLCEIFRRQPDARRSIHLRSSISAIGPDADIICAGHELTPYSWGSQSPYGRLIERDALMVLINFAPMGFTPLHWVECQMAEHGMPLPGVLGDLVHYKWQTRNGNSGSHAFYDRDGLIKPSRLIRYFNENDYKRTRLSGLYIQSLPARIGAYKAFELAKQGITIYPHIR